MKKLHNNKLALGLTIGFSTIALATVGFSSWVISVVSGDVVSNINVEVADIKDKSVSITNAALLEDNNTFVFGPQSDDHSGSLQSDGDPVEHLTFGITYKVNINDVAQKSLKGVTAKVTVSNDGPGNAYTKALNDGYFVSPLNGTETTIASATDGVPVNTGESGHAIYTTVDGDESSYTCTTIFTYKWGAAFSNLNPAVYVDDTKVQTGGCAKNVEAVKDALTSLYEANGAKLTITLSPTLSPSVV